MAERQPSARSVIAAVTAREYRKTLGQKGVVITAAVMAALCVIVAIGSHFLFRENGPLADASEPKATQVAVVGVPVEAAEAASTVDFLPAEDEDAARAMVASGDVAAALVPQAEPQHYTYLAGDDAPEQLLPTLEGLLSAQRQAEFLQHSAVDPVEFAAASAVSVTAEDVQAHDDGYYVKLMTACAMAFVLAMFCITFAGVVGQNVVEEKSSRVVEIILATVPPLQFLVGKIAGSGLAGLTYMAGFVALSAVTLKASALPVDVPVDYGLLLGILPAFLLGYLFFATLYAATGSLVSRMEDFSGAQLPVVLLLFLMIYGTGFGASHPDGTFMHVAAWIPPLTFTAAPIEYATGYLSGLGFVGCLLVAAVACGLMVLLAAHVYPRSVLRMGKRVTWREALKR